MVLVGILIITFLLISFLLIWFLAQNNDKKKWNNGQCAQCGNRWINFDTDSQGGRGYKCEGRHYTWISYPVDRYPDEQKEKQWERKR